MPQAELSELRQELAVGQPFADQTGFLLGLMVETGLNTCARRVWKSQELEKHEQSLKEKDPTPAGLSTEILPQGLAYSLFFFP